MENLTLHLSEIMKESPPYSVNSIITGIGVCFSAYLDIELPPPEKINSDFLKYNIVSELSKRKYPENLSAAFDVLCKYIADDSLLRAIYSIIGENKDKQELKITIESLIQGEFIRLSGSETGTPPQLNKLCMAILNPVSGSFYDGTAGSGGTAIDACLHAEKSDGSLEVNTQEVDILCYAVSVVRAYIHGIDSSSMYHGNTLTEPKHIINDKKLQSFDFSVMFPPLRSSWKNIADDIMFDKYRRFFWGSIPTSDADWLFVQHLFSILKDNGKGIIALPSGALFNAALNKTREEAILTKFIECIITLPHGMLLPYTAIPISLMVINKAKVSDAKVLMIQAEGLFPDIQTIRRRDASRLDDYVIKRICEIYQNNTETAGISSIANTDTLRKNNWILIPARYIRSETIETEYGNVIVKNPADDWTSLRSAGKFYTGINVAPYAKADEIGEYRIINLADVQGGEVQPEYLSRYNIESRTRAEKYKVKQGDILISCKGAAIKVCVIPKHTENILMSINFIGIRIYQEKFNPLFIKYYLESPAGQIFLQSKQVGTSIITLTARDLEDIPLPNLPFDEQNEYVKELTDIEERIRIEKENLYTLSKNAKWNFYESIGLGKIMKKEEV